MTEDSIETRVKKFHLLQLPGQPQMMHMGTSYLVHDMWKEIERLQAFIQGCAVCKETWDEEKKKEMKNA